MLYEDLCHEGHKAVRSHTAMFDSTQGAKKVSFTAGHSGKL